LEKKWEVSSKKDELSMKNFEKITLLSLFILVTLVCHKKYMFDYPMYTHAWSQSDRYALATGFVDNNLTILEPQTSVYNHPIPNNWKTADATRRTSVDFPIHDYIPAVFMKIFGSKSPFFFRFYILLYGFLGAFYLYKLSKKLNNSILLSSFIVLFTLTTPVFVYYHSGFLPTIPSLANAIIGTYFYFTYFQDKQLKSFYWALFFLCLSALARTTFVIPLFALLSVEFLHLFAEKKDVKKKLIALFPVFFALIYFYLYNNHVRETYGSLFLNKLLPAKDWTSFKIILKDTYDNWRFHYFSITHYLIFSALSIIAIIAFLSKKIPFSLFLQKTSLFVGVLFTGNFIFFLLMVQQYSNHDYYFLDTFFLPIILLLAIISHFIAIKTVRATRIYGFLFIALSIGMLWNARKMQETKRITGPWDNVTRSVLNFQNSEKFVQENGISKNEKIIVLNGFTPNIPFVLMNRTGYCTMLTNKKAFKNALKFPAKYVIFQNEYFLSDIHSVYPSILKHLKFVASNGKITICTKSEKISDQTLEEFLNLDSKTPIEQQNINFENSNLPTPILTQKSERNPNNTVGLMAEQIEYGNIYQSLNNPQFMQQYRIITLKGIFEKVPSKDINLVAVITEHDSLTYYKEYQIIAPKKQEGISKFTYLFNLPKVQSEKNEIKLYFWNPNKSTFQLDQLEVKVY
jgi:hypothetical protein